MADVNLTPPVVNLLGIRAGDRNAIRFTLTADGAPMDLTGYAIDAQARPATFATGAINAVVEDRDDPGGAFTLRWPGADVATAVGDQPQWKGVWDLQVTASGETDARTLMAGTFTADHDVTRPGEAFDVVVAR